MPSAFTPVSALAGGVLIGLAASLFLLVNGRVAGISGLLSGLLTQVPGDRAVRGLFLAGMMAAGVLAVLLAPEQLGPSPYRWPWLAAAGLLVGFGTRVGGGCTSGHGLCGISRGSVRSVVATITFMGTAVLTLSLARWFGVLP
jgi:uncharacterized membrane protein YedE/YeeE